MDNASADDKKPQNNRRHMHDDVRSIAITIYAHDVEMLHPMRALLGSIVVSTTAQ